MTAKIDEMDVYLLIDTGATVSLLSNVCNENMHGRHYLPLEKIDRDVLSTNGSSGSSGGVHGKAIVSIVLNGTSLQQERIVADISVDEILGLVS